MLNKYIFYDNNNIDNTVLLVGTGRSGTTWIEDIINCDNDFRVMFEPFNTNYVGFLKHWEHRQYIPLGTTDKAMVAPIKKILSGSTRNKWIDRFNKKLIVKRRLVKDIRIHASLKWINVQYPQIPIVYVIRHPCAVAKSKEALNWFSDLTHYTSQKQLNRDFLHPFLSFINEAKTPFQQHIVLWCIENYLIIRQFERGELLITFYEDFCTKPNREAEKIFKFLNLRPKNVHLTIDKPSALSAEHSAINLGQRDLIGGWQKKISDEENLFYLKAMKIFSLEKLYNESPAPQVSADVVLDLIE